MKNTYTFKVISDEQEAKEIWNIVVAKNTLDDEWNFRNEFRKHYNYPFHFITAFQDNTPVGLLALQYNNKLKHLEFFGGDDTDNNRVISKNSEELTYMNFLDKIAQPALLAPLAEPYIYNGKSEIYNDLYTLNISDLKDYHDYLNAFWNGKSRKKLLKQIEELQKNYEVKVVYDNYADIDVLLELNRKRFGTESSFQDPIRQTIFKGLAEHYDVKTLTITVDGKKEAVSFAIPYNGVYNAMNVGVNPSISNLGKYLILMQINNAISLGCKIYDTGKKDTGWKEAFKLTKHPQYKLTID